MLSDTRAGNLGQVLRNVFSGENFESWQGLLTWHHSERSLLALSVAAFAVVCASVFRSACVCCLYLID